MTTFGSGAASRALRRLVAAAILAAAAMLVGSTAGNTPTASAAWDRNEFDACTTRADTAWLEGDISNADHIYFYELCCGRSGGMWTPHGNQGLGVCGAQPAIAASTPVAPPSEAANPDVPAGPPPPSNTKPPKTPKTTFTLAPIAPVG